jgi:hypothetical protein
MEKYSNKAAPISIQNKKTTSELHVHAFILINKPDTFNFCKFIVRDVHCVLIYAERV